MKTHSPSVIAVTVVALAMLELAPFAAGQFVGGGSIGGMSKPPPPEDVAKWLSHPNVSVRRRGASNLYEIGAKARDILPAIRLALTDVDFEIRLEAALCLAEIDPSIKGIVPVLVEAFDAGTSDHLSDVVSKLIKLEPARIRAVVDRLTALLASDNHDIQEIAIHALQDVGPAAKSALPALKTILESDDQRLRHYAISAIGAIGPNQAVPALLAALHDKQPDIAHDAASALSRVVPMTREIGQALLDSLKRPDDERRDSNHAIILKVLPIVPNTVQQLVAMLFARPEAVRYRAMNTLANLGSAARLALPALMSALQVQDSKVRCAAARALGAAAHPDDENVLNALIGRLSDPDGNVRAAAVEAIRSFSGEVPLKAVFVRALQDQDPNVRASAGSYLGIESLCSLLENERAAVRKGAAGALASSNFFPRAGVAEVSCLLDRLVDVDPDVRQAAAEALGTIGTQLYYSAMSPDMSARDVEPGWVANNIVPPLVALLRDADAQVRAATTNALGAIGSEAGAAAGALADLLSDPDPAIRRQAAWIMYRIEPYEPAAINAICSALRDSDPEVRYGAISVLRHIKAGGAEVRAALIEALASPDPKTRGPAAEALGAVGPASEVTPLLVCALADSDRNVQEYAAMGLGELGAAGAKLAMPALLGVMGKVSSAANAIISICKQKPAYIDDVIKALESEHARSAVSILQELGVTRAAPALVALCGKPGRGHATEDAVAALAELGPDAKEAVSIIVDLEIDEANEDYLPQIQECFAQILHDIGPAAVPELLLALRGEDSHHRLVSAWALGELGASVEEVVPALVEATRHPDEELQTAAVKALGRAARGSSDSRDGRIFAPRGDEALGRATPGSSRATSALLQVLGHASGSFSTYDDIRENPYWATILTIVELGEPVVPALVMGIRDKNPRVRDGCSTALAHIGSNTSAAMPVLLGMLFDVDADIRLAAVHALQGVGRGSAEVLAALKVVKRDEKDITVRGAAIWAIKKLESE